MPTYNFTIGEYPTQPSKKIKILTGQYFGRLFVIGFAGTIRQKIYWHCLCKCGNGVTVSANNLRSKHTQSCGCSHRDTNITHGATTQGKPTPEYRAFQRAKNRCQNPHYRQYHNYGGRGIEFRFESFEEFYAEVGQRPLKARSIERIDNNGHYEKGNIEWATQHQQSRNRRTNVLLTAFNKTQCLQDWAKESSGAPGRIQYRLQHGWCIECAISLPAHSQCHHKAP